MKTRRLLALAPTALLLSLPLATTSRATSASPPDARALDHADEIRIETTARYGPPVHPQLVVTEASSTGVVESFTLLEQHGAGPRVVSAETGVYFAVCPVRATCPAPAPRYARRAIDFLPRRQALELAVRTFLETSASIVAVSLPTRRPRLFIAERAELGHRIDLPALGEALAGDPAVAASSMRRLVDRLTRPRIFVPVALDATPGGGDTFVAAPLWPGR